MKAAPPELRDSRRNRLLGSLPQAQWQALAGWMKFSHVNAGQVLYEGGGTIGQLYFPIDCVLALVQVLADGAGRQTAVIGREAAVGLSVFLGSDLSPCLAVAQSAGWVVGIDAAVLKQEFRRGGSFMELALRCLHAQMGQQARAAVCIRHHSLEQQLSVWLLLSLDRMEGHELAVTHELLAGMLGVRRESVTEALHKLQARGLIHPHRGRIELLDRTGLEHAACECYCVIKRQYEFLGQA